MDAEMMEDKRRREPLGGEDTCNDCVFFEADDDVDLGQGKSRKAHQGTCRSKAPAVVVINDKAQTVWPRVERWWDVCGEGRASVPEAEA